MNRVLFLTLKSLFSISLVAATTVTLINFPSVSATADARKTCGQNSESDGQFYLATGATALTRERAISRLRKAEFHYSCSKNEEMLAKVRAALGNVNQIDFAQNRRVVVAQWRATITEMRKAGVDAGNIAWVQAQIKEIESLRD